VALDLHYAGDSYFSVTEIMLFILSKSLSRPIYGSGNCDFGATFTQTI